MSLKRKFQLPYRLTLKIFAKSQLDSHSWVVDKGRGIRKLQSKQRRLHRCQGKTLKPGAGMGLPKIHSVSRPPVSARNRPRMQTATPRRPWRTYILWMDGMRPMVRRSNAQRRTAHTSPPTADLNRLPPTVRSSRAGKRTVRAEPPYRATWSTTSQLEKHHQMDTL